jgi:hypothetical protein
MLQRHPKFSAKGFLHDLFFLEWHSGGHYMMKTVSISCKIHSVSWTNWLRFAVECFAVGWLGTQNCVNVFTNELQFSLHGVNDMRIRDRKWILTTWQKVISNIGSRQTCVVASSLTTWLNLTFLKVALRGKCLNFYKMKWLILDDITLMVRLRMYPQQDCLSESYPDRWIYRVVQLPGHWDLRILHSWLLSLW